MKGTARLIRPCLTDNPGTWLDFTDLVFIDPVGTGFSRAEVPEADAKKLFYSTTPDIEYLSRVIYDWLVKNEPARFQKISGWRELWRISRSTDHVLSAVATGRGDERRGAGVAVFESHDRKRWQHLSFAVDADPALDHGGSPGAGEKAHAGSDGRL